MLSGTLSVIEVIQGSRPVSRMSALQYRVFLSEVQRSNCSDGIMKVFAVDVLVNLLVLWRSSINCPKLLLNGTCLELDRRKVAFSFKGHCIMNLICAM